MNMDAELYSSRCIPLKSAKNFLLQTLPQMGWDSTADEVVLDVGCGPGGTTKNLILPLFKNARKILAIDVLPGMIATAKRLNYSPQIEYYVANIENWATIKHMENQASKLVSILCFNWLKDQTQAFHNVFRILKKGGEAAIFFALQGGFFEATLDIQRDPRWSTFFKGIEAYVPESQNFGYEADYYKHILKEVGFEVLYCKVEEKVDVFTSEDEYRKFYTSICVLREYVPENRLKEFENEYMDLLFKKNGRDSSGLPRHRGKMIELVIKKKKMIEL